LQITPYLTRAEVTSIVFSPESMILTHWRFSMQEYDTLKQMVAESEEDVAKAIGGNKAAGTRVRKKMQEIKAAAQAVRQKILEGRESEPGPMTPAHT